MATVLRPVMIPSNGYSYSPNDLSEMDLRAVKGLRSEALERHGTHAGSPRAVDYPGWPAREG